MTRKRKRGWARPKWHRLGEDPPYPRYFDRDGEPLKLMEWARLVEEDEYRRVAWDELPGGVRVSTVWVGINYEWHPDRPPLIFETMILGGPHDGRQWRYATLAAAAAGHGEAIRLAASGKLEESEEAEDEEDPGGVLDR